jgi:pimeloyl-ACP methyl ester carboxylesterase
MLQDGRGRIDCQEEGSGPTILFVPGSWGTGSVWRGAIAALGGRFRVVTMSLLGYGATQERRAAADTSIDPQAEIVETVARAAGCSLHLVGHSYGGLVCLAVAMRGAVPLASLTLLEPVALGVLHQTGEFELHRQVMTMRERYFRAFEAGHKDAASRVIDFFIGEGTFGGLPQRMRDHIVATTPTHFLDMQSVFDPPLAAYAKLALPTLVIRGEHTHPALSRSAETIARAMPNGSLATVPGASHFMTSTHPGEVAGLVADHVCRSELPR